MINNSDTLNQEEFTKLLQEHCRRYYNNDSEKNKDERYQVIPDSVYDSLVEKYEERFGPYTAVGAAPCIPKERAEDEDSDQESQSETESETESDSEEKKPVPAKAIKAIKAVKATKKTKLAKKVPTTGETLVGLREEIKIQKYMGSLSKAKDANKLRVWRSKHPGPLVYSDKIDGVSASTDGKLLWTRGDGTVGVLITHLKLTSTFPRCRQELDIWCVEKLSCLRRSSIFATRIRR